MFQRLKKTIQKITPYIFSRDNFWPITGGLVLTGMGMGLDFLAPYLYSEVIVALVSETATTTIIGIEFSPVGLMAAGTVVSWSNKLLSNYSSDLLAPVGPRAEGQLLVNYVDLTLNQSPESRNKIDSGQRSFDIQNTFRMIETASQLCNQLIPTGLRVIFGGAWLSKKYGAEIGLGLGGVVLVYTGYNIATKNRLAEARDQAQKSGTKSFQTVNRTIANVELAQLFNNEAFEKKRFEESHTAFINALIAAPKISNKVAIGQDVITEFGQGGLCMLAVHLATQKSLTPQDVIFISTYLRQFFSPLSAFGFAVNQFLSGMSALETVFTHMENALPILDEFPDQKLEIKNGDIVFDRVTFSYPDGTKIFDDVSFTIRGGEKVGIVGKSGMGKSTIGKLLYRFYDISSGAIYIDGQDITTVGLKSLREAVGIIQQESVMLNDTIYNNVAYGGLHRGATEAEIKLAAEKAQVDFVGELKEGWQTKIGEQGISLSGGQKQRVAIARVLLKNSKIIILDEATASLDSKNEQAVQTNIDAIAKKEKMTSLVIAHKLTNVMNADKILVIDKGKIVEQGTHDQLMEHKSHYYQLWVDGLAKTAQKQSQENNCGYGPGMRLYVPRENANQQADKKDEKTADKTFTVFLHSGKK